MKHGRASLMDESAREEMTKFARRESASEPEQTLRERYLGPQNLTRLVQQDA
jgi:hypothetical protein